MAMLFVDLLGARSRWHEGGRAGAEAAFREFELLFTESIPPTIREEIISGGIETDSAAIICTSAQAALRIARHIYYRAFTADNQDANGRIWLRGVITLSPESTELRRVELGPSCITTLNLYRLAPELLDAISVEKSGYRGMRILVDKRLINTGVRTSVSIPIGDGTFIPLKRLSHSIYPLRVEEKFQDYMWMACEGVDEWNSIRRLMADRLRWCSHNQEEFLQAAATQVVFNECNAIIHGLRRRNAKDV